MIKRALKLTQEVVERGERGRVVHAGKVLCEQRSLVKTSRSCYAVISVSKMLPLGCTRRELLFGHTFGFRLTN